MSDECIFCKIAAGDIPADVVYQDDHVFAFLDIGPIAPGHTLVIPRTHVERIESCPPDVLAVLARTLPAIANAVVKATNAPACNLLNNNGRPAGQLVNHLHFHIIPRKPDDGLFPHWPASKYPQNRAAQLAQAIRSHLDTK